MKTPSGGKPFDAWFDAKTHLLAKIVEKQGSQTVTTTMSDYRTVAGVIVPYKTVIDTGVGEKYLQTLTVTKLAFVGPQPDSTYEPPKVTVADFSIAGGAAQTVFPIQLVNNHIYGEAKINGKGPYTFIFDTGGHNIVAPPLAKELGLKVEGNLPGTGAGEGVMEGGFAHIDRLEIGNAAVKDQLFVVFTLDKLSDIEGVPLPGMVGYETFRRFVTRIDYGGGTVTLIDPKHFDPKDAGTPVPSRAKSAASATRSPISTTTSKTVSAPASLQRMIYPNRQSKSSAKHAPHASIRWAATLSNHHGRQAERKPAKSRQSA